MDDQAAWVEGLRRGDKASFDAVFVAYRGRIWGFLVRLSGRREVADELLQETFLRLAAHARDLRADTRLTAWLFTVARNLYRSHRRWAMLDGQRLAELAARALRAESPITPMEAAAASEVGRKAEAAIAALPEIYREVALLVLVDRLEPSEAAEVLGQRPDAVRQRLARARQSIALALGGTS